MSRRVLASFVSACVLVAGGCKGPVRGEFGMTPAPLSGDGGDDAGMVDDAGPADAGAGTVDSGLPDHYVDGGTNTGSPLLPNPVTAYPTPPDYEPTAPATEPFDKFQTDFPDAYCAYIARCNLGPHDSTLCHQWLQQTATDFDNYGLRFQDVADGGTSFNPMRAARCLQALQTVDCNVQLPRQFQLQDCAEAFVGMKAQNDPCLTSADCGAGLFCLPDGENCGGSCQPQGIRCVYDIDCPSGQVCVSPQECEPAMVPPGDLGEPCGTHGLCNFNTVRGRPTPLGCFTQQLDDGGTSSTCEPLNAAGGPCDDLGRCYPGSSCILNQIDGGLEQYECFPDPPAGHYGDGCLVDNPATCQPGLACIAISGSNSGRCVVSQPQGGACTGNTFECGGALSASYCSVAAGVPAGAPSTELLDGGPLTDGGVGDIVVDGGPFVGTCVQRPSTGECAGDDPNGCDPLSAYCDMTQTKPTCVPFKMNGAPCTQASECGPWFLSPACDYQPGSVVKTCSVTAPPMCK